MSLHQWDQFMELGKDVDDSVIEEKIKSQRPEQCALLVYTVGFLYLWRWLFHFDMYTLSVVIHTTVWDNRGPKRSHAES